MHNVSDSELAAASTRETSFIPPLEVWLGDMDREVVLGPQAANRTACTTCDSR
jgi:hypothetical protein